VAKDTFSHARELLLRVVSMLVRMVRSLDARTAEPEQPGTGTLTGTTKVRSPNPLDDRP
jgi:hypothetical protein